MSDYPASFTVMQDPWPVWGVWSDYGDGIYRLEVGYFWRSKTAMRIAQALTKNYRTGHDQGRKHVSANDIPPPPNPNEHSSDDRQMSLNDGDKVDGHE